MASAAVLYTPEVLALATALARFPLTGHDLPLSGSARSPACGSRIEMGLGCGADGRIARIGLRAQACAVGQASAAIFAQAATGQDRAAIAAALAAIQAWLGEGAELPDWPGLGAIAAAQAYPGRHGAILLPWKAALEALPSA